MIRAVGPRAHVKVLEGDKLQLELVRLGMTTPTVAVVGPRTTFQVGRVLSLGLPRYRQNGSLSDHDQVTLRSARLVLFPDDGSGSVQHLPQSEALVETQELSAAVTPGDSVVPLGHHMLCKENPDKTRELMRTALELPAYSSSFGVALSADDLVTGNLVARAERMLALEFCCQGTGWWSQYHPTRNPDALQRGGVELSHGCGVLVRAAELLKFRRHGEWHYFGDARRVLGVLA